MAKKSSVTAFKNRKLPNIGMIFFAIIFIYVIISVYMSSKEKNITGYQVKLGVLSENRQYTGIALRNEHCIYSVHSGYINYLIREGERAGFNNLVYCIDETGKISDIITKDPTTANTLSQTELKVIKQDIINFSKGFDETEFFDAELFSNQLNKSINQIENRKILENISNLGALHINDIVDYCKSGASGIVLFYLDGFENLIASDLSPDDFDLEKYSVKSVMNDDLIAAGDFVYKYVNDENWSIVISVPNEDTKRILSNEYVEVKFTDSSVSSWGKVSLVNTYENESLIELSFTNSMVSFAKQRFVKIELVLEEDAGLKIPNSAIVYKEFFLINHDFVYQDDNSNDYYVFRREYGENGEFIKRVYVSVLKEDLEENVYYVDKNSIKYGEYLIKQDAPLNGDKNNVFVVGDYRVGTLPGVYCINKGYADFKRIAIKYSDDEYTIISNNAAFGLRAYDYIALDAAVVSEKDFVY